MQWLTLKITISHTIWLPYSSSFHVAKSHLSTIFKVKLNFYSIPVALIWSFDITTGQGTRPLWYLLIAHRTGKTNPAPRRKLAHLAVSASLAFQSQPALREPCFFPLLCPLAFLLLETWSLHSSKIKKKRCKLRIKCDSPSLYQIL